MENEQKTVVDEGQNLRIYRERVFYQTAEVIGGYAEGVITLDKDRLLLYFNSDNGQVNFEKRLNEVTSIEAVGACLIVRFGGYDNNLYFANPIDIGANIALKAQTRDLSPAPKLPLEAAKSWETALSAYAPIKKSPGLSKNLLAAGFIALILGLILGPKAIRNIIDGGNTTTEVVVDILIVWLPLIFGISVFLLNSAVGGHIFIKGSSPGRQLRNMAHNLKGRPMLLLFLICGLIFITIGIVEGFKTIFGI